MSNSNHEINESDDEVIDCQFSDARNNPAILWRGSKTGDLLRFARTWVGNDLEECLQAVYDNRSEAEF